MHTTALCSPSRSCGEDKRDHHSNGMACITEFATGYPGYNGVIPLQRHALGDAARPLTPSDAETQTAGRWHAASSVSTRRRHQPVVSRPRLRRRGGAAGDPETTSAPTSSTSRSSSSPMPGRSTPTDLLPAPLLRRHARAHRVPKDGPTGTPASSTSARDATAEGLRPPTGARHRSPRALSSRVTTPTSTGTRNLRGARLLQPHGHGGLRRFPQPHRPPPRASARLPARRGLRQHHRHGHLGQLAPAPRPGWGPRTRRSSSTTLRSRSRRASRSCEDKSTGRAAQPLSLGLDLGRQHPIPALEARDLPRRPRRRPVHRLLARSIKARARSGTSTRTSSTWCRPSSTCSASSHRRPSGV